MKSQKTKQAPSKGFGGTLLNLAGVLSAVAIAFGGWFLVQDSLAREQEKFLNSGGLVELPQTGGTEVTEAEPFVSVQLTEAELLQLVQGMEQQEEMQPHEPVQGQLTMAQAMERAMAWLEESFLSRFGLGDTLAGERKVSCYLWAPEAAGQDSAAAPWLSCWTVSVRSRGMDAVLTMSAVSGQILDVSVSCSVSVPYDSDDILALLEEHADSFGLEGDDVLFFVGGTDPAAKEMPLYQSIGTKGIYAAIRADSEKDSFSEEFFSLHLYLCSELQAQ